MAPNRGLPDGDPSQLSPSKAANLPCPPSPPGSGGPRPSPLPIFKSSSAKVPHFLGSLPFLSRALPWSTPAARPGLGSVASQ